ALDAKGFAAQQPWAGAASVVVNWMFLDLFGPDLGERTLELVHQSGIHMAYDPQQGVGTGLVDSACTAALVIDLLESGYGALLGA
ncbi:MAG: hypothetical protein ACPGUV_07485, partial [Polyangiales bacterium]